MIIDSGITPRSFLFVTWEGGGNVTPILGLAHRLVERGHYVRVISDPCNEPEVKAAGCEFTPYSHAPHRTDKSAASTLIKDYEANSPINGLRVAAKVLFSRGYAEDVLEELKAHPVDVCCVNDILMSAFFAPEKVGIPTVALLPNCNDNVPAPSQGLAEQAKLTLTTFVFQRLLLPEAVADLQNTRKALGLPPMRNVFAYLQGLSKILIMTSRAFDSNGSLGSNFRYIGPILDDPTWTEAWQSPWPADHPDPLVVVGLSTTYQNQEELLQKVMDAMDGLKIRGLVTLGPTLNAAQFKIPSNVIVRQSVPHAQVFPLASAVITHGGHGTTIRALSQGVPVIAIPFGRDQGANAARVAAKGVGLKLDKKANVDTIREAIQRVINEPTFRLNAQRLGKIILEDAQSTTGVEELEQVAATSKSVLVNA